MGEKILQTATLSSNGKLILLSGPSGAGKSTMLNILISKYEIYPLTYYTTRPKRKDDNVVIFKYLTIQEYINMQNDGNFIFSFGTHNNRYGVLSSEFNNRLNHNQDIILVVSYNDFFTILKNEIDKLIDIHLVVLSFLDFRNIEKRLKERDMSIDDNYLKMKIDYAMYEHQKYFDIISTQADCIIHTDNTSIDVTESIICDSIYKNNDLVLRRRK